MEANKLEQQLSSTLKPTLMEYQKILLDKKISTRQDEQFLILVNAELDRRDVQENVQDRVNGIFDIGNSY